MFVGLVVVATLPREGAPVLRGLSSHVPDPKVTKRPITL